MASFSLAWPLLGELSKIGGWRPPTSAFTWLSFFVIYVGFPIQIGFFIKPLKTSVLDKMVLAHVYILNSYNYDSLPTLLIV